jgi:hypothetical protein
MSRRVTLPGADELFRATGPSGEPVAADMVVPRPLAVAPDPGAHGATGPSATVTSPPSTVRPGSAAGRSRAGVRQTPRPRTRPGQDRLPSGRERHDEKITVYLSPEELVELEGARLALRGEHGLAVDRGRIVREALSVVLADLEARGDASTIVRRLRDA